MDHRGDVFVAQYTLDQRAVAYVALHEGGPLPRHPVHVREVGSQKGVVPLQSALSTQPTHIHSVAVSADGRCFAWGCGSDGRTGLRAFMRGPSGSKRLMKCYVSSPSVVEALEDKVVIDACACRNFTVYVVGGDQQ